MPKIKIMNLTKPCANHVVIEALVNDVTTSKYADEFSKIKEFVENLSAREIVFVLMYCDIKKAGATTLAQMKTAILNKEYEW